MFKIMKQLFIVLLLLTGCISPENRAEWHIQKYGPYCEKLGFQQDTAEFGKCVQQARANAIATYDAVTNN